MIAVVDLIAWAKENAWGRSATVPDGWISSELIQNLVYEIKKVEPLHYNPQTDGLIGFKVEPIADTTQTEERQELEAYRKCIKSRSFWDAKHCDDCYFYDDCPFNEREDEKKEREGE